MEFKIKEKEYCGTEVFPFSCVECGAINPEGLFNQSLESVCIECAIRQGNRKVSDSFSVNVTQNQYFVNQQVNCSKCSWKGNFFELDKHNETHFFEASLGLVSDQVKQLLTQISRKVLSVAKIEDSPQFASRLANRNKLVQLLKNSAGIVFKSEIQSDKEKMEEIFGNILSERSFLTKKRLAPELRSSALICNKSHNVSSFDSIVYFSASNKHSTGFVMFNPVNDKSFYCEIQLLECNSSIKFGLYRDSSKNHVGYKECIAFTGEGTLSLENEESLRFNVPQVKQNTILKILLVQSEKEVSLAINSSRVKVNFLPKTAYLPGIQFKNGNKIVKLNVLSYY